MNADHSIPERHADAKPDTSTDIGTGAFIYGPVGTGKSYRAAELMRGWIDTKLTADEDGHAFIPQWVNVPRWLHDLRESFDGRGSVLPIEALLRPNLLVLDDIGVEKPTAWALDTLYVLVSSAYDDARTALIVTSNLPPADLAERIGARCVDRLLEICSLMPLVGPSRRNETAKVRKP